MLAANETVAEDYYWQQAPFLYRSMRSRMGEDQALRNPDQQFRLLDPSPERRASPEGDAEASCKVAGSPEEALLARLALRSMKQAKYTTDCMGHFGLAANYYTTSPPQSADTRIFRSTGSSRRTFTVSSRRSALPTTRRSCRRLRSGHHPGNALRTRRSGRPTSEEGPVHGTPYRRGIHRCDLWNQQLRFLCGTPEHCGRHGTPCELDGDYYVFDEGTMS